MKQHTEVLFFNVSWCNSNEWIVETNAGILNVRKDREGYYVSGGCEYIDVDGVPTKFRTTTDEFEQQLIEMAKANPKCRVCQRKKCKCRI